MKKETKAKIKLVTASVVPDNVVYSPLSIEAGEYEVLVKSSAQIILNHRTTEIIDFGCVMNLPEGFRINGKIHARLAALGLVCGSVYLDADKRLKFIVTNCGKQTPVIIQDKEPIGTIWIEPINYFEWT